MNKQKKYRIGVEVTLEVMGGKWKSVILYHLTSGKKRTNELRSLMPEITQRMLTKQLRELERDKVINRYMYNEIPLRVEYELTEYGWSLKTILDNICDWGVNHLEHVHGNQDLLEPWEA
ncbi:winged helix-turn-helix transcriptional regulator [Paenibacillus gorillae]|uniref:winged helix-turn-helix transcriptional regulator n=1 Tax=Paenibacillus gorillae TaxID=1243662 RepID=UPI0005A7D05D|nr:winged helix-turn-helix transcriptional regulator [Paenibacillus gorillae]